jgi:hypothetical protein
MVGDPPDLNEVVVLGDLNDGQDSNTLEILSEQPRFLQLPSAGGRDAALIVGMWAD